MVDKIKVGKRYRIDLSKWIYITKKEDVRRYSNNNIILISEVNNIDNTDCGLWRFKNDNGKEDCWYFRKDELLPIREEAFLEIFKEEIYG